MNLFIHGKIYNYPYHFMTLKTFSTSRGHDSELF